MSEIIKKRLKESKEKKILVFLKNDFRFEGILKNSDEEYFEFFDFKKQKNLIKKISEIEELEVD